jgi:hypothetical protein
MIDKWPVLCFEGGLFIWGLAGMSCALRSSINRMAFSQNERVLAGSSSEKHSSHCGWHTSYNVFTLDFSVRAFKFDSFLCLADKSFLNHTR